MNTRGRGVKLVRKINRPLCFPNTQRPVYKFELLSLHGTVGNCGIGVTNLDEILSVSETSVVLFVELPESFFFLFPPFFSYH